MSAHDTAALQALDRGHHLHPFSDHEALRAIHDSMMLAPPLVIDVAGLDELVTKVRRCLDLTWSDLQA